VHGAADIAGGGSRGKPSACLIAKTNVGIYVLTKNVHGVLVQTLNTLLVAGDNSRDGHWVEGTGSL
jgi:hypothetical protein